MRHHRASRSLAFTAILGTVSTTMVAQAGPITLVEVGAYGSGDSVPAGRPDVFENLALGVVLDSSFVGIDVVGSRLLLLRVNPAAEIRHIATGGGVGQRVLGRFLGPCCIARRVEGGVYVLDQATRSMTVFNDSLNPVDRFGVELPRAASLGGLISLDAQRGWLVGLGDDSSESVVYIDRDGRAVSSWRIFDEPPAERQPRSWPVFGRTHDRSVLLGSGRSPRVAKLSADGAIAWSTAMPTQGIPDPLPDSAPPSLRDASFRVSSIVQIPDGRILVTVFRPSRRHTLLVVLSPDGNVIGSALYPIPIWLFGVAANGLLVGARIREFQELVVFRVGPAESP